MKKIVLLLVALVSASAMAETLDVDKLVNGTYSVRSLGRVTPLADGEHYAQVTPASDAILRYSFRTGQVVDTLFSTASCRGCTFKRFDGYILSPAEDRILIQTETKSIYRRSFTATYYIYNVANRRLMPLSEGGPQQVPTFSPDGKMIAFVRDNNLFLVKLMFNNAEVQVTTDGARGEVINGHADWVYEEEFGETRYYAFSADSRMLAYMKSVERDVPEYAFPLFAGAEPRHDEYALYPGAYTYKYPVPGVKNSTVTVHSFDIKSSVTRQINVPLDADGYIPRIAFTEQTDADGNQNQLAIVTLNRHQNRMDLYMANARSTVSRLALREECDTWLAEPTYEDIHFYPTCFVLQSERTGYNQLYLYDLNGTLLRPLTSGNGEVTAFYGYDEKTGDTFYQSDAPSPLQRAVYKADKKGKVTPLTGEEGTHSAIFSKNLKYFIHTASSIAKAPVTTLESVGGRAPLATLIDNSALSDRLCAADMPTREFFSFTTTDGVELNGWMVKPATLPSGGAGCPVVMYQYSGPGSQEVKDEWGSGFYPGMTWECLLAQQGIISVCVDGRGTGGRGADFKKCTYLHIGTLEARDQAETARWLARQPYIDSSRIAIWGWSYGGYMTLMAMSETSSSNSDSGPFCAGIAVAPPTDWRFYDSVYTERFMQTPQENGTGYDASSALLRAPQLGGRLLLVHGMADDNVHFRNTAEYSEALVQANRQFDMQIYTNRNHSIYGGNTRRHLFNRMLSFWQQHLLR